MQQYKWIGCILAMITLSSCSANRTFKKSVDKTLLQESIARLSNIPDVPIGVYVRNIVKSDQDPDSVQIFCHYGSMSAQDLKCFYFEEMERVGWKLKAEHAGVEYLLYFAKPSGDICIVSIRGCQQLVITLMIKKETS